MSAAGATAIVDICHQQTIAPAIQMNDEVNKEDGRWIYPSSLYGLMGFDNCQNASPLLKKDASFEYRIMGTLCMIAFGPKTMEEGASPLRYSPSFLYASPPRSDGRRRSSNMTDEASITLADDGH